MVFIEHKETLFFFFFWRITLISLEENICYFIWNWDFTNSGTQLYTRQIFPRPNRTQVLSPVLLGVLSFLQDSWVPGPLPISIKHVCFSILGRPHNRVTRTWTMSGAVLATQTTSWGSDFCLGCQPSITIGIKIIPHTQPKCSLKCVICNTFIFYFLQI